ncbi:MAG: galactonate dehydratase [Propionibacteriaceae bacterium]
MQITSIETFKVPPRWLFVRIGTDEGVTGWGEPVVEGRADTVRACVGELSPLLIGQDPLRIEDHWQVMTKSSFYRGGPIMSSAVAGLDQALWDICGKVLGVPVHVLLGGPVRDRIRLYTWVGGDDPSEVGEQVAAAVERGFTAVKMNASGKMGHIGTTAELDAVVNRAAAAKEVLGPDRDVALDGHGRLSLSNARQLARLLEPVRPLFFEEPVLPEYTHLLRDVVESTTVPIATGERLFSRRDFLPALQAGIAIAQPDLSHAGGISEVHRIASLADMYDVAIAPHCPLGPLALASSLQIGFATPNYLIQEQSQGIHYNTEGELFDLVTNPEDFAFVDGWVNRLTRPGLGVEIDEQAVRTVDQRGHAWGTAWWRHDDGAFAEW